MGSGIFNIGMSGLSAAQMGVTTTSHNIANASTPGYTRQTVLQTTPTPLLTGGGFVGQGTSVTTVQRIYNQYLTGQILSSQTAASSMSTYSTQIQQLDNLLADPSAGLSPALTGFFSAVQDLAANPSSTPARQAVLSGAQALVSRFQAIDQRISEIRDGVNEQIGAEASAINSLAAQIGDLNHQIVLAQSAGGTQPANDLLDQRDQLIADLNKEIRVTTATQSDGTLSVFIGNGQPLVVGSQVSQLSAVQDLADPEKTTLAMKTPYGGNVYLTESVLTGGKLGGLLAFRNESLDSVQNAVGRVALGVTQAFNEIHNLGQDLTGALGVDVFSTSGPVVNASSLNASAATVISAQIINSDYRVAYSSAAGGSYAITRISDGSSMGSFASLPQYVDGVRISLASGAPANGDVFLVKPGNTAGSRVVAESDNTGSAVLDSTGSNLQALGTSDFRLDYSAANTWTLTRLSDNSSWVGTGASAAAALSNLGTQFQTGFNISLSGTAPTVGDSFVIEPTRTAARNLSLNLTNTSAIAAAAPIRTGATQGNTGTGTISAGSVLDASYLPLSGNITLTFNSATNQFSIAGATPAVGNIAYNPATQTSLAVSFNGLSFTLAGTPKNGDTFTVSPNANGVSDNRNAQLLGNLQTASLLGGTPGSTTAGASATFQSAYSQIVSQVGNKARQVETEATAQQTLADQAQTMRDSTSGVNLDEEAANLMKYQQAYQASAKIIEIAGKLFDQILQLG